MIHPLPGPSGQTVELTRIAGLNVLFVMAAEAEYGPHLAALFRPLLCGIGPVEAGVTLTRALGVFLAQGTLPDLVVSLGSAGSARLHKTGVYQATSVSWRDIDASALGFPKGITPLSGLPATLPLPLRIPGVPEASLSTGANVVSGAAYQTIPEDMVDMETWAALRACQGFDVPLIALRGISDGDKELEGVHDWHEYLHVVDERLAEAVGLLTQALETGGMAALRP
ncbi:5'-methylthioadenosine/S-adenosylhomocysteine nucleosidase [Gemmobacter lutimaris]|uniref:5'-methylthioadenosine/S-adenosylhomocysteine nucleosidase n=1 Tax=Gemmobacter lutimaris TaxID=2306023 RepID=A0A398BUH4_9RHOB|nr:5'-methylthioadenosine/S-adenosylhomocysteine nucleosidase [Gemmobacter lutimaris]RID92551.1 5'-methylthioadenosine/S-adenosylhomocysteine nucleosidase [Gemmobacter lutimaris]